MRSKLASVDISLVQDHPRTVTTQTLVAIAFVGQGPFGNVLTSLLCLPFLIIYVLSSVHMRCTYTIADHLQLVSLRVVAQVQLGALRVVVMLQLFFIEC